MDQRITTRTIAVIIAAALVVSVGSLTALQTFPADATKPKHNDDGDSGNSNVVNIIPSQQSQLTPLGLGTSPNTGSSVGSNNDFASQQLQAQPQAQPQQQQLQAQQAATSLSSAACGQVVSGVVNLTANLNCSSGDGIIVGGPNTVINMNGFSITGPGQDSSKVGIMVPNVDNVVVNGPGSISNFQA
ncbi:MAG TPA: hypothetical protein VE544_09860, partial [Nitrososphaeraceae archaeon]|nr:hypothetical protein [Nitrososphaeraceae archaeon]